MKTPFILVLLLLSISLTVLSGQQPNYSVYLIGDTGETAIEESDPVFTNLEKRISREGENSAILFLGDNIYNNGLPPKDLAEMAERRKIAEEKLLVQLHAIDDFEGKIYFIPGNHDWNNAKPDGIDYIRAQEEYIEFFLDRGDVLIPDHGCPGPEKKKLGDDVVLIAMDSQWWLHPHTEEQQEASDCKNKNIDDIIQELKELLEEEEDKQIIVALHHPIYSDGGHNGHFLIKDHLFPLTLVNSDLWIPLPVIGSLYPFYRSAFGDRQDMPHPLYENLRKEILKLAHTKKNIIFVSGHEHNLQYFFEKNNHFIKSGSGSKSSPLPRRTNALFSDESKGYAKLEYFDNGQVLLKYFTIKEGVESEKYNEVIIQPEPSFGKDVKSYTINTTPVIRAASQLYEKGGFHKMIFGKLYREDWFTPVEFRPFNLSSELGGLRPRKIGGGMSSKSIRLKASNKKQYVLRSVEKGVAKVVPEMFRQSVVQDIFQDQIAASQPYAALVVPPFAEALGVYHTNPELVYLPEQPALGDFNEEYGDELYLFEERPSGNQEDLEEFGNSRKIISYTDMLDKIQSSSKNHISQDQVLRSRLLDIYLGDWDRHDDQWRWASFKGPNEDGTEKHTYYEPIPRDRDQVLFRYQGLMPKISKMMSPELRKFQTFESDIKNLKYLGFNARHFDRSYLNELPKEEWIKISNEMTKNLTDEVIDEAVARLPVAIRKIREDEYRQAFRDRRSRINEWALEHYKFLSEYVNVVGTRKNEHFSARRLQDGKLEVNVHQLKKKGELDDLIYSRVFDPAETKEVRLFGLQGKDEFHIEGKSKKGPKIRIIGGRGNDELFDTSELIGNKKSVVSYDKLSDNGMNPGSDGLDKRSDEYQINNYDRKEFYYDLSQGSPFVAFNPDDGLFVQYTHTFTNYGFRKKPFKSLHNVGFKYAFGSSLTNFFYNNHYTDVIDKADFVFESYAHLPNNVSNFFGLTNNKEFSVSDFDNINFFRFDRSEIFIHPAVSWNSKWGYSSFKIGPYYRFVDVGSNENKFITDFQQSGLDDSIFERSTYLGLRATYELNRVDNIAYPTTGIKFSFSPSYNHNTTQEDDRFATLKGSLTLYNYLWIPKPFVLATKIEAGVNFGDFNFYQGHYIGQANGLRGFRIDRFGGESSLLFTNDLRIKIGTTKGGLPMTFGLIGAYDFGRVWNEGEINSRWHQSYGGGFFMSPFDIMPISFYYLKSTEGTSNFMIRFGFAI